jgi:FkbM family methyltransferase
MDNFFDKALHFLGKNSNNIFTLNIGAMDGVMFDEMIGYTNMYNFKGLYVEPIPYLFEKLKKNIPTGIFENSAISDYNGEIDMITIDRDAIDNGLVHDCFYGMSAVYPPKNGLGSEFDKPTVEKYGKIIKVPCITFNTLLKKNNIKNFNIIKIDTEGHDYKIFKQINLKKYKPDVIRLEWINLSDDEKKYIITAISNILYKQLTLDSFPNKKDVTIVTGIWDIKRDTLSNQWSRTFDHYLGNFEKLLKSPNNFIIYIEKKYESWVWERRDVSNTKVIVRELDWFKSNKTIFNNIQKIRILEKWYSQSGWLSESTQAKLEMYNPIVMSKMFLLNDASLFDPFDSTHMIWIDGAITNTVHEGYFWKDQVFNKIPTYFNKFTFVCFPYDGKVEIHGFEYSEICKLSKANVNKVARGGIFGGPKDMIRTMNKLYYDLLHNTLENGFMGTEESLFTILTYSHPELIQYYEIEMNGLLGLFFENLKNDTLIPKQEKSNIINPNLHDKNNIALYALTYNSPSQFEKLCLSFELYDKNFIDKPKKFLINNSLNHDTDLEYKSLCQKYGFEEIKKNNIGICGGRQFIAEHAEENGFDYYFFFEDDMFFYLGPDQFCRNGFRRKIENFYNIVIEIIWNENFDFLKWNFSEFFGDNTKQWAWHNIPENIREILFPDNPKKINMDVNNAPYLNYKNIKSYNGIPYASGEIFYCNWPQVVSRKGNKKMFLDTKFEYPYEQTWMSFIYQETVKNNINPGILLMTPTEHNRFEFYEKEERREH